MPNLKAHVWKLAPLAGLALLYSCSHGPVVQEFPDTASPRAEVKRFQADVAMASQAQADVLSPNHFKDACDRLLSAQEKLEDQADSRTILHEVAEGRAYLRMAQEASEVGHHQMENVITARQRALEADAPRFQKEELAKADDELRSIGRDIESGDLKSADQARAELQAKYMAVELRSIKERRLGQAKRLIEQAREEDADHFAPRSLARAEKAWKDADLYITSARHDNTEIQARSDEATRSAQNLLRITRESKEAGKTSPEEIAFQNEGQRTQIRAQRSELEDREAMIAAEREHLSRTQESNAELRARAQDLSANLASEQAIQKTYEDARKSFSSDEAEVYKQGDQLTVRLRGLQFPKDQSSLKGEDFALLAKVRDVIRSFGPSDVTVEGHTDSSGGRELNQRLSQSRAEAVREYLAADAGTKPHSIEAVGKGYEKPLASNKTAEGRAENRRVDVIIRPQTAASDDVQEARRQSP